MSKIPAHGRLSLLYCYLFLPSGDTQKQLCHRCVQPFYDRQQRLQPKISVAALNLAQQISGDPAAAGKMVLRPPAPSTHGLDPKGDCGLDLSAV